VARLRDTGLLTGVVGGLIGGIGSIVVMAVVMAVVVAPSLATPSGVSMTPSQVRLFAIGGAVFVSILVLLGEIGFGAGMGALGGLIGANSYRKSTPASLVSNTPGYPGYPLYPRMPAQSGSAPQAWNCPNPPQYQHSQQQGNPPLSHP
jgi:hypothetical protein